VSELIIFIIFAKKISYEGTGYGFLKPTSACILTKMIEFFAQNQVQGIVLGLCTFLIIGLFHPIVVKAEYYFGTKIWWLFLLTGIGFLVWAWFAVSIFISALLAITGFSCLWSIIEVFDQEERVKKGWFPKNPKRKYDF
jgi:hypothetical protein